MLQMFKAFGLFEVFKVFRLFEVFKVFKVLGCPKTSSESEAWQALEDVTVYISKLD